MADKRRVHRKARVTVKGLHAALEQEVFPRLARQETGLRALERRTTSVEALASSVLDGLKDLKNVLGSSLTTLIQKVDRLAAQKDGEADGGH